MPKFKCKKDQAYEDRQNTGKSRNRINVNGEILEWVPKHVYLGSVISGDGDGPEEIKGSLALATNKLLKLKFLWHGQHP